MPTLKEKCLDCDSTEAMLEFACHNTMDYCLDCCGCDEHSI